MGKDTKAKEKTESERIPFDDALRRLVNTPPKHKPTKKPAKKSK